MSDETYTPPTSALTLREILDGPIDTVEPVDCANCPINMMCQESTGGTGFFCESCGATSVYVEEADDRGLVNNILIVDCNKHRFEKNAALARQCGLCDGAVMQFYAYNHGAKNYYLPTVHAGVSLAKRQETLRKAYKVYVAELAEQDAKKKEKLAEAERRRKEQEEEDRAAEAKAAAEAPSAP